MSLTPAVVLAGIGIGCAETAEHAAVAPVAPAELRRFAFGLWAIIPSVGNLVASANTALLWTGVSPSAGFVFLTAAMAVALLLIAAARVSAR